MPEFVIERNGRTFDVTASNQQEADAKVDAAIGDQQIPAQDTPAWLRFSGAAEDVARSGLAGLERGILMTAGLPGDIERGARLVASKMGLPEEVGDFMAPTGMVRGLQGLAHKAGLPVSEPSAPLGREDLTRMYEGVRGEIYEPQTVAGEYARTAGEFIPALAAGPSGVARRVVSNVVIPSTLSETAGQITKDTAAEPYARAAGAITGILAGPRATAVMQSPIPRMTRRASGVMREAVGPGAQKQIAGLGDEAMLLDVSPSALGTAQGVVTKPGRGRDILVNALMKRHTARNPRIRADVEATLGPAVPPRSVDANLVSQQRALGPSYDAVKKAGGPVDLSELSLQINNALPTLRGKPAAALKAVQRMIAGDRGVSATEAHNIRRAIDDAIQSKDIGTFERTLLTDARAMVDNQLAQAAPGIKALDETYQQLAREREALEAGADVLGSGKGSLWPEELAAQRATLSTPEKVAQRVGARGEIERAIRTTASDPQAMRRVVKGEGDWNREKLAQIFGEAEADRIINAVDREAAFADAYNKIVQNSQTAQRQQASRMIDAASEVPVRSIPPIWERLGALPEQMVRAGARGIRRGTEAMRSDALRAELAEILTRRGGDLDETIEAILRDAKVNPRGRQGLARAYVAQHEGRELLDSGR